MKKFFDWLKSHYRGEFALTPFSQIYARIGNRLEFIGVRRIFIFGVKIADIQETKPWE